jgi:hypothetical protein
LSAQLRKSVAGFRLPDYGGGTTTVGSTSSRLPAIKEKEPAASGGNAGNAGSSTGNSGKMRKVSGFGA